MAWPYRNYCTYLGRWLQAEKLGITPNSDQKINPFNIRKQYKDGMNLYEYVKSRPIDLLDPFGCYSWSCPDAGRCSKIVCKCLKHIPYFKAGARSLEMGWCNFCAPRCKTYCLFDGDVEESERSECEKKCIHEHGRCVLRGGVPKCAFKFKISNE